MNGFDAHNLRFGNDLGSNRRCGKRENIQVEWHAFETNQQTDLYIGNVLLLGFRVKNVNIFLDVALILLFHFFFLLYYFYVLLQFNCLYKVEYITGWFICIESVGE